jgi:hypothetical protein
MKKGDKVIWDSGFGYEICEFIGDGVMYYTYAVKQLTGSLVGEICSFSCNEIFPYTDEKYNEMVTNYKYSNMEI